MNLEEISAASTVRAPDHYWTLSEAIALIRGMQPQAYRYGYHLCLGGGVLNTGVSKHDLDLYFLPFNHPATPSDLPKLKAFLKEVWSGGGKVGTKKVLQPVRQLDGRTRLESVAPDHPGIAISSPYLEQLAFFYSGLRIDVFILGAKAEVKVKDEAPVNVPVRTVAPPPLPSSFQLTADQLDALRQATRLDAMPDTVVERLRAAAEQLRRSE